MSVLELKSKSDQRSHEEQLTAEEKKFENLSKKGGRKRSPDKRARNRIGKRERLSTGIRTHAARFFLFSRKFGNRKYKRPSKNASSCFGL